MRRVAIHADRNFVRLLFPEFSPNDFLVDLLDLAVTLLAGLDDVVAVDAGFGVVGVTNVMRRVAVGTDGGDDEALFVETLTVDRFGIMAQDAVLRDVVLPSNLCAFFVAATAHERDIELGNSRLGIAGREDVVFTMAIPAFWSKFLAGVGQFTVKALMIDFRDLVVTKAAIDRLEVFGVREVGVDQVDVTIGALERAVDRFVEAVNINV